MVWCADWPSCLLPHEKHLDKNFNKLEGKNKGAGIIPTPGFHFQSALLFLPPGKVTLPSSLCHHFPIVNPGNSPLPRSECVKARETYGFPVLRSIPCRASAHSGFRGTSLWACPCLLHISPLLFPCRYQ